MSHFHHDWDFFYRPGVLSFLKECFLQVCKKQKLFGQWKFYPTKHPTDLNSDLNFLISSRAFVQLISVLQPSFSKIFFALWWISSASHLQLDFFFGAGLGFDFTLLHFIGVCGAFFHRLKYGDFHTGLKTSFRKTLKYWEN